MTCTELKALAPLYALGALDDAEREACAVHLAEPRTHEGCEAALREAESAAELLALELSTGEAPSPHVWAGIESELRLGTDRAVRAASRLPRRTRSAGTLALAASVAAVSLLLGRNLGRNAQAERDRVAMAERDQAAKVSLAREHGLTVDVQGQLGSQIDTCRRALSRAEDQLQMQQRAMGLLAEPKTQVVALAPQAGQSSSGSVIFNAKTHEAVFMTNALTPVGDHDYELWVIRGKDKIAAGLLKLQPNGPSLASVDSRLLESGVDVFAITLEPAGGGPVPRGSIVLAGAVKKG